MNNHYNNHQSTPWRKWWQGLKKRLERARQDREGGEKARDKGDTEKGETANEKRR